MQHFPDDSAFPATSLHFEGAPPDLSEVELLEAFSRHFQSWVNRWLVAGKALSSGKCRTLAPMPRIRQSSIPSAPLRR